MPTNRTKFWTTLLLALATLIALGSAYQNDFVNFDDGTYVYDNPMVKQGLTVESFCWAFKTFHGSNWHPLTWISHMIDCQFFAPGGSNPSPMHTVNVALHLANVLLLLLLLWRMTGHWTRSLFVAALFAVHPLRVESVAWISERKDVLSVFFGLLTMLCYFHYSRSPHWKTYCLVIVTFALSLLAKPMLVTLPMLLLLLDYWPLNRLELSQPRMILRRVLEKIPLLIMAIASSIVTMFAQQHAITSATKLSKPDRIAHAILAYFQYIQNMLWPDALTILYPLRLEVSRSLLIASAIFLLTLSLLSIWIALRHRTHRHFLVGWFWFLGTLVPVIGFVQVGSQELADRYTYIPCIGLLIAIIWSIPESFFIKPRRLLVLASIFILVLAMLITLTRQQVRTWGNSLTLWSWCSTHTNANIIAFSNLGYALMEKNHDAQARQWLTKAYLVRPDCPDPKVSNNLGLLHDKLDEPQLAIYYFDRAIAMKRDFATAWFNRGVVYQHLKNHEKALESFTKSIEYRPEDAAAWNKLGITLAQLDRIAEARDAFEKALKLQPGFFDASANLKRAQSLMNPSPATTTAK